MVKNEKRTRYIVAVDCVVFGFDGSKLRILLIRKGLAPKKHHWSLMGGLVQKTETTDEAAARVLKALTGLDGVYLEQMHVFSQPDRDPLERTLSVLYFALIDISKYKDQLNDEFKAEWFPLNEIPDLIYDHNEMVTLAKQKLRYKAAMHPLLFELLPEKFTLPILQSLFEDVYETTFDKGNFSRKILSTGFVIKQKDKDMEGSKKGAFYYKLNKKNYRKNFHQVLRIVPLQVI
jgi:ADP-ribose pyrophosphatase YjhB (NUDIX family)